MDIKTIAALIHINAVEHGWWDKKRELPEIIALCHSELSEALEEYRSGHPDEWHRCNMGMAGPCNPDCEQYLEPECPFRNPKPEGIAVELADCIIRILDYCEHSGIDMERILQIKHNYNKTRPYRHGNKAC